MSRLSIICPVYNVEQFVIECIESVLYQLNDMVELLLINDGSTDRSRHIIDSYKSVSGVRIFDKENGGLSDARNYGLKLARYEYVMFLDSDDVLASGAIDKIIEAICIGYDLVSFDVYRFNDIDKNRLVNCATNTVSDYSHKPFYACNKVFKKKVFDIIDFPVGKKFEDISTIPILINSISNCFHMSEALYGYRVREGAITTSTINVELEIMQSLLDLKSRSKRLDCYNLFIKKCIVKESFGILFNLCKNESYQDVMGNAREINKVLRSDFDFPFSLIKSSVLRSSVSWFILSNRLYYIFLPIIYFPFSLLRLGKNF
ncbi:hypothetical protein BCT10_16575 [Vibrio splendidus]|uniref:glycosyltransferase family 2 protein n=1 Tax=Vibrio splendidus TaxID=29497 RepID=UPI000C830F77|nr:glycosyltransferase family 2 protein [Vibrio splendidus]PMO42761.1 hypothetical protein BCT10_16575 [Vibrio splendidus]